MEVQNFSPSSLVVRIHLSGCCGFACVGCENLLWSLCFCYISWALIFHFPWGLSFADLACGSVAPPNCKLSEVVIQLLKYFWALSY
jgi:hypothetical protein